MKKYETKEEAKMAKYLGIKKWRDKNPEKIKKYNSEYYKRKIEKKLSTVYKTENVVK